MNARQESAKGACIDEAAEFRDKAAAVAAYARQRNDVELEVWFLEIRLRASIRIGELVGDLDTAQCEGPPGAYRNPDSGISKDEAIEAAGLTRTDAYNCQQLAGGKKEAVAEVAHQAAEAHFLQAREEKRRRPWKAFAGRSRMPVVATLGPLTGPPPNRLKPLLIVS